MVKRVFDDSGNTLRKSVVKWPSRVFEDYWVFIFQKNWCLALWLKENVTHESHKLGLQWVYQSLEMAAYRGWSEQLRLKPSSKTNRTPSRTAKMVDDCNVEVITSLIFWWWNTPQLQPLGIQHTQKNRQLSWLLWYLCSLQNHYIDSLTASASECHSTRFHWMGHCRLPYYHLKWV